MILTPSFFHTDFTAYRRRNWRGADRLVGPASRLSTADLAAEQHATILFRWKETGR